jgi:hypothetical protein
MRIDPPYKHLTQKSSFCGPASLQMVLFRRGIWVEQEELAKKLGTRIRNKNQDKYLLDFEINDNDAGLNLLEFNQFGSILKEYGLKAEVILHSKIEDLRKLIENNLENGNDIMVNLHRGIYDPQKNWGHFCLVNSIENDQIEICDPSYEEKSYWKTSIKELMKAMSKEVDGKERGLVMLGPY